MGKTSPTCPVAGLVLAAGYSRRFGSDKRRSVLDTGRTLLGTSLTLPCALLLEVWVVLRPDESPGGLELPAAVKIVQDPATPLGMGHSIAAGARRLTSESQAEAVAIFLADMPLINRDTLEALLASATPDRIVIPSYRGTRGHPVLFGKHFWPSLSELSGDGGARSVIERFPEALNLLELDDPGILLDVDTPQDWHALLPSRD